MSEQKPEAPFFVGWAPAPGAICGFLLAVSLALIAFAGLASYMVAATQSDPGDGAFMGRVDVAGVLQAHPYPVLHVTDSDRFDEGTALILSGGGKFGVDKEALPLDGQLVKARGVWLSRGDLNGLQIGRLEAVEDAATPLENTPLGRWKLTGEICDGKCLNGAMRPGQGLAHKACANLCLLGGVPPVFVSTGKVDGTEFFLLGDAENGKLGPDILDQTATLVEVEGEIMKRGELHVFNIDSSTIRRVD